MPSVPYAVMLALILQTSQGHQSCRTHGCLLGPQRPGHGVQHPAAAAAAILRSTIWMGSLHPLRRYQLYFPKYVYQHIRIYQCRKYGWCTGKYSEYCYDPVPKGNKKLCAASYTLTKIISIIISIILRLQLIRFQ